MRGAENSHPVRDSLKALLDLQGRPELSVSNPAISGEVADQLERVFFVANDADKVVGGLYGQYANLNALNGVYKGFQQATSSLHEFLADGNTSHIANARNHIDGHVVPNLRNAVPIGFETHPRTEAALESYRKAAESSRAQQNRELRSLNEQLNALKTSIAAADSRVATIASQTQSLSDSTNSFLDDARSSDQERIERYDSEFRKTLEQQAGKLTEALESSQKHAQEVIERLEKKRSEASAIVQSVGDLLTTGTYADRASKESDKADKFRAITVGLFAFGLLIIVSNYVIYAIGAAFGFEASLAESWQSLGARIATGLAVALPAFYTARESARHRTNADVAKQRELELTTLGPFIELLPEEQKTAIRDRLTDRYFGGEVEPHDVAAPVDMEAMLKAFMEAAKKSNGSAAA